MYIFKSQNLLEFSYRFKVDEDCKEYIALLKAKIPFKYTRCNHRDCQTRTDFSRQCNICIYTESATVETLFRKVKYGVRKAFFICFEMSTPQKAYQQVI